MEMDSPRAGTGKSMFLTGCFHQSTVSEGDGVGYHCPALGPTVHLENTKTGNSCKWGVMYEHILSFVCLSPAVLLMISIECCQWDGGSFFPLLLLFHNKVSAVSIYKIFAGYTSWLQSHPALKAGVSFLLSWAI